MKYVTASLRRALTCCCLAFALPHVQAAELPSGNELTGIWEASAPLGQVAKGELTVDLSHASGQAKLDGHQTIAKIEGSTITFDFGSSTGRFRGALVDDKLNGFWIQPASSLASYAMATPVRFRQIGHRRWIGIVRPLIPRTTLYLVVDKGADGSSMAFIRDYQRNIGIGRRFKVDLSGARVELSDAGDSGYRLTGSLDEVHHAITMAVPDYGTLFRFVRTSASQVSNLYPTRTEALYRYRQPIDDGDGWTVGSASSVGLDAALLETFVRSLAAQRATSASSPAIQAVLVARHGKLVLDEYFYGYNREDTHDIRSAGKTLTATLVGIAQRIDPSFTTNTKVYDIFSNDDPDRNLDPRKKMMTIENLITMTSGYNCDDENPKAPGNEDVVMAQKGRPDWTGYIVGLPMISTPGGRRAVYCSVDIHLAGASASRATGIWLPALFDEYLAKPLDFLTYHWDLTPTDQGYGGGGQYLRPRDLLKIGQLYLSKGRWRDRQLISPEWVYEATQEHSVFDTGSEAPLRGSEHPAPTDVHGYGYGWHLLMTNVEGKRYREYVATGNGGQIVAVIPDLDLVVGFASSNYNNGKTWWKFISNYIPEHIIPAINQGKR